jgi:transcriptional regulator with XRE-family HTH domain
VNLPKWSLILKELRERDGLTQEALGNIVGIEQTIISKMERGVMGIGIKKAMIFAEFFNEDFKMFLEEK